ncbi:NfeD family protein [Parapedobacter indicus]|uniref:Membrane-bound serine protease (ClpP class) n=1 Tax=Parapedobacter indicus TaxID=1477437 RepID=A0A1I3J643_9SPHI|nr:NfeD family protein [Parapedobacter indicus]PPL02404.1 membrane-bound serine protease (ClpP class) [Parapedobacter indicus]SFI55566.1 membrane-bound serine protease (ClpP class) [Parapedobacter indicus]
MSMLRSALIVGWILSVFAAEAQHVYQFDLEGDIGPGSWRTVKNAYLKAEGADVDLVLIKMNTFGGMVNFADSIRSRILDSPLETVVFINHNAASAGALIALACDRIYMSKGSGIGAASVVDQSGQVLPEKHQSYMRGLMRATAEAKGRDPKIAEAFVDGDIDLPAIKPAGKILTLTSSEAVKIGLAEAEVASTADLLKAEEISNPQITIHQITVIDRIISFLINPAVSGILILLIIGGIYFEMQTPGIGFALVVAVIAAMLFFAPLYIQGLADNWEIALFIAGIVLILLELFVIPGFGVAGILGIICLVCGLAFSMVVNDYFNFSISEPGRLFNSFLLVIASMVTATILMVIFGKNILKTKAFKRLVLQDEQRSEEGYTSSRRNTELVSKEGVAKTVLRPSGKVEIDGKWYDAVALDGFIDIGEDIYVEKHENYNLFVRKKRIS